MSEPGCALFFFFFFFYCLCRPRGVFVAALGWTTFVVVVSLFAGDSSCAHRLTGHWNEIFKGFFIIIIYFAFSWLGCCMANKKTGHTLPFSFSRWGIIRLDSAVGHRHRRDLLIYATATGCYWLRYIRLNHHRHLIFPPHLFVSGRTVAVVVNHLDKHKRHNKWMNKERTNERTDVPCGNMKGETCGCVVFGWTIIVLLGNYGSSGLTRRALQNKNQIEGKKM